MSSAGAQAVAVPLPCWPCRPSAWASIGLIWVIWAISSCASRRSWNGSHLVLVAICAPYFMGPAARWLGEDADPGWLTSVHLPSDTVHDILNTVHMSRSLFRSLNMKERSACRTEPRHRPTSAQPHHLASPRPT